MKKFSLWWKDYYGFMIVPFLAFGLIVLFRYEELSSFVNISFLLFSVYIIYNFFRFARNELKD